MSSDFRIVENVLRCTKCDSDDCHHVRDVIERSTQSIIKEKTKKKVSDGDRDDDDDNCVVCTQNPRATRTTVSIDKRLWRAVMDARQRWTHPTM
jgi:hypothetical protein